MKDLNPLLMPAPQQHSRPAPLSSSLESRLPARRGAGARGEIQFIQREPPGALVDTSGRGYGRGCARLTRAVFLLAHMPVNVRTENGRGGRDVKLSVCLCLSLHLSLEALFCQD